MSKAAVIGFGLVLTSVLAIGCAGTSADRAELEPAAAVAPAAAPRTTAATAPGATVPSTEAAGNRSGAAGPGNETAGYGVGAETVVVSSVTDGDTFRVGDRRIRVIGIDSCEAATTGGQQATASARRLLSGATVTLTREPGVDRDRFGREVRYVRTSAGDFGRLMVPADHTGVYRGGNNASASYLAGLTALDTGARSCGASTEPAPTTRETPKAAPRTETPRAETPRTDAPRPKAPSGGAYYKNCSAARAAGAAPLYRGQPGYASKLDRDNDGVACE